MEINCLKEVIECLTDGRRLEYYSGDQYAFYLLEKYCKRQSPLNIASLKATPFAKLLQRPGVKTLLANFGDGLISHERLRQRHISEFNPFVITLSHWGDAKDYSWAQTSVPGANLVMQLNLTNQHDQLLRELNLPDDVFKCYAHPIHESKSSLSWARIDFDFATGEALIEEIQNDWLRKAERHYRYSKRAKTLKWSRYRFGGEYFETEKMLQYTEKLLAVYRKVWQEITLYFAIKLIHEDLGLQRIFYHSYDTGAQLKNIGGRRPPQSLYTDLPKQFCFEKTSAGPRFILDNPKIRKRKRAIKDFEWYALTI